MVNYNFHMHTNFSDGTYSYKDLLSLCVKNNLKLISITDHDNVVGVKQIINYIKTHKLPIEYIVGVELTARYENGSCHILAYNFDVDKMEKFIDKTYQSRKNKVITIVSLLNSMGYNIKPSEIKKNLSGISGRRDIAEALVRKGYFSDVDICISTLLSKGCPCYIETFAYPYDVIIPYIKSANGICVLAHPWTLNASGDKLERIIDDMVSLGLDGIEIYNHNIDTDTFKQMQDLVAKKNLLATAGTDFHGKEPYNDICLKKEVDCCRFIKEVGRRDRTN